MKEPKTITDLRSFIGLVGFYNDLFLQQAHILKPLTDLGNLRKGTKLGEHWTQEYREAFEKMKAIAAADCLLAYPDHKNLTFENFNTQRVLRWRCFIEEFNPHLFYIEGKKNFIADAFS